MCQASPKVTPTPRPLPARGRKGRAISAQVCSSGFLQAPDHEQRDHRRRQQIEVGDTGDSVAWISQVAMNGANPPKMATESAIELP
jgi:hypothetical protein